MHKLFLTLFSCVTINLTVWGQLAGTPPSGALSQGLGGISSIDTGDWSIFNNPAGLASIENLSGVIGYQTILNFSPFNTVSAAFNTPTSFGNMGIGIFKFGDDLFNSQMASIGLAQTVGIVNFGIKVSLLQINIEGFGKSTLPNFEIGALTDLSPQITIGTYIYNVTQSTLATDAPETIPTIVRLSIDYHPNEQFNLYTELEKDIALDPDLKIGISYRLIKPLALRTGISVMSNRHSFGAGLVLKYFDVDYAIRRSLGIGATHNLGLIFRLNK